MWRSGNIAIIMTGGLSGSLVGFYFNFLVRKVHLEHFVSFRFNNDGPIEIEVTHPLC